MRLIELVEAWRLGKVRQVKDNTAHTHHQQLFNHLYPRIEGWTVNDAHPKEFHTVLEAIIAEVGADVRHRIAEHIHNAYDYGMYVLEVTDRNPVDRITKYLTPKEKGSYPFLRQPKFSTFLKELDTRPSRNLSVNNAL